MAADEVLAVLMTLSVDQAFVAEGAEIAVGEGADAAATAVGVTRTAIAAAALVIFVNKRGILSSTTILGP